MGGSVWLLLYHRFLAGALGCAAECMHNIHIIEMEIKQQATPWLLTSGLVADGGLWVAATMQLL